MSPHRSPALERVYAAPQDHDLPIAQAAASARRLRTRAAKWLAASVLVFALSVGVSYLVVEDVGFTIAGSHSFAALPFAAASLLGLIGAGHGIVALFKGVGVSTGPAAAAKALGLSIVNLAMTLLGATAAALSTVSFTRGRQIRRFGRVLLPPVETGGAWTATSTLELVLDDGAPREALAAQWRENGRTEHASVAAFARVTLDLIALGAPPTLLADAQRDALDEIRHAELCFGLARALDRKEESPGAFPAAARSRTRSAPRTVALAQLAVDSLIDGALHEGLSARIVAKLARRCAIPAIAHMLREIASDEGRHARHGWDVVMWCLKEGGEPVARALEGALGALPRVMTSPMPEGAREGGWERFGIMGEALEADEHAATRAYVERRTTQAIAKHRAARTLSADDLHGVEVAEGPLRPLTSRRLPATREAVRQRA